MIKKRTSLFDTILKAKELEIEKQTEDRNINPIYQAYINNISYHHAINNDENIIKQINDFSIKNRISFNEAKNLIKEIELHHYPQREFIVLFNKPKLDFIQITEAIALKSHVLP